MKAADVRFNSQVYSIGSTPATEDTSTGHPSTSSPPVDPIFICFRGPDTRENITSLVYEALCKAGFEAFMDEESIPTGHDIYEAIHKGIEESMGAVVILSKDFASSTDCLDELVAILDRKKKLGSAYALYPIYVDGVDPDDVGKLRGRYRKAIAKHKRRSGSENKVEMWSAALTEVTRYKGKPLNGKYLGKFINEMVEEVREEFKARRFSVKPRAHYPEKCTPGKIKKQALTCFKKISGGCKARGFSVKPRAHYSEKCTPGKIKKHAFTCFKKISGGCTSSSSLVTPVPIQPPSSTSTRNAFNLPIFRSKRIWQSGIGSGRDHYIRMFG